MIVNLKISKMKNSYILLVFLALVIAACNKSELTTGGPDYVYGQVYWQNHLLINNNPSAPVKQKEIYIAALPSDSSNYIYHVKTDNEGRFTFNGLKKNTHYLIFFKDTIQGNTYSFYKEVMPTDKPYSFKASIAPEDASGVLFHVSDIENAPIFGAKIYLFRSRVLAESEDPTGSLYQIASDSYGQAMKTGLSGGQWYALALFNSDSLKLSALAPFVVEEGRTAAMPLVLQE